ncbi:MAG: CmcI family methyltransferase [Pseudomonadota bacterium]
MKFNIDTETQLLIHETDGKQTPIPLYSTEAFEMLSKLWLKVGWNQKYSYTFSWMGRPIIQLPEDILRMQEVIYRIKPTLIIETGVAHGGSLIFYASLCKAMEQGRIIGVDIEIRPHNRAAIESHELASYITLIEGNSVGTEVLEQINAHIKPDDHVLIILDSCHTKQHVLEELKAYSPLVSLGSYIVATDGAMQDLYDVPRGDPEWKHDHPSAAAEAFAAENPAFIIEQPIWPFNESDLVENITYWPSAWLRRINE